MTRRVTKKRLSVLRLAPLVSLFFVYGTALAAGTEFVPLAPLPGTTQGCSSGQGTCITPETYLPGIFKIGIGAASALAVLAIAYSGIKYMTSDVVTSKSDAIQNIKNALLGLLLALSAYLILFTINPKLVTTNFSTIPTASPLPGPTNYTINISYFLPRYEFNVQRYEYLLGYSLTAQEAEARGVLRGVQERYSSKSACDSRAASLTIKYGAGSVNPNCTPPVRKYDNYTEGTLITSLNQDTFEVTEIETVKSDGGPDACESRKTSLTNAYGELIQILTTCTRNGNSTTLQTKSFATPPECTTFVSTLPAGTIFTKNCT